MSAWLTDDFGPTMAKATGLLFDVTSARKVHFTIPLYIQYFLHGLASVLLCIPFTAKSVDFVVGMWWLPFVTEIVRNFHSDYFDSRDSFQTHTAVWRVEHIQRLLFRRLLIWLECTVPWYAWVHHCCASTLYFNHNHNNSFQKKLTNKYTKQVDVLLLKTRRYALPLWNWWNENCL